MGLGDYGEHSTTNTGFVCANSRPVAMFGIEELTCKLVDSLLHVNSVVIGRWILS